MNELDLLRLIDDPAETLDVVARQRAKARLETLIADEVASRPPHRRSSLRRMVVIAAAAAAVVLLAIFLPRDAGGPRDVAAEQLGALAHVASLKASGDLPSGMILYAKTRGEEVRGFEVLGAADEMRLLVPVRAEYWRAPDGSGRVEEISGPAEFASPEDEAAWITAGRPDLPGVDARRVEDFSKGELEYTDLSAVETDPARLAQAIVDRRIEGSPPGASYDMDIVADLLRITELSPEGRASVFRATGLLPGVEYLGRVEDHQGRAGIGFSATSDGRTVTLIFDPGTSALLEEQLTLGGVETWKSYLQTGVVAKIGERP